MASSRRSSGALQSLIARRMYVVTRLAEAGALSVREHALLRSLALRGDESLASGLDSDACDEATAELERSMGHGPAVAIFGRNDSSSGASGARSSSSSLAAYYPPHHQQHNHNHNHYHLSSPILQRLTSVLSSLAQLEAETRFNACFSFIEDGDVKLISRNERSARGLLKDSTFTYGEICFGTFVSVMKEAVAALRTRACSSGASASGAASAAVDSACACADGRHRSGCPGHLHNHHSHSQGPVFVDLGSGAGKALVAAASVFGGCSSSGLFSSLSSSTAADDAASPPSKAFGGFRTLVGIELLEGLHVIAEEAVRRFIELEGKGALNNGNSNSGFAGDASAKVGEGQLSGAKGHIDIQLDAYHRELLRLPAIELHCGSFMPPVGHEKAHPSSAAPSASPSAAAACSSAASTGIRAPTSSTSNGVVIPVYDWAPAADILFANSTCFDDRMFAFLATQVERMRNGSIIITFTRQIEHPHVIVLSQHRYDQSWGYATVFLCRVEHPLEWMAQQQLLLQQYDRHADAAVAATSAASGVEVAVDDDSFAPMTALSSTAPAHTSPTRQQGAAAAVRPTPADKADARAAAAAVVSVPSAAGFFASGASITTAATSASATTGAAAALLSSALGSLPHSRSAAAAPPSPPSARHIAVVSAAPSSASPTQSARGVPPATATAASVSAGSAPGAPVAPAPRFDIWAVNDDDAEANVDHEETEYHVPNGRHEASDDDAYEGDDRGGGEVGAEQSQHTQQQGHQHSGRRHTPTTVRPGLHIRSPTATPPPAGPETTTTSDSQSQSPPSPSTGSSSHNDAILAAFIVAAADDDDDDDSDDRLAPDPRDGLASPQGNLLQAIKRSRQAAQKPRHARTTAAADDGVELYDEDDGGRPLSSQSAPHSITSSVSVSVSVSVSSLSQPRREASASSSLSVAHERQLSSPVGVSLQQRKEEAQHRHQHQVQQLRVQQDAQLQRAGETEHVLTHSYGAQRRVHHGRKHNDSSRWRSGNMDIEVVSSPVGVSLQQRKVDAHRQLQLQRLVHNADADVAAEDFSHRSNLNQASLRHHHHHRHRAASAGTAASASTNNNNNNGPHRGMSSPVGDELAARKAQAQRRRELQLQQLEEELGHHHHYAQQQHQKETELCDDDTCDSFNDAASGFNDVDHKHTRGAIKYSSRPSSRNTVSTIDNGAGDSGSFSVSAANEIGPSVCAAASAKNNNNNNNNSSSRSRAFRDNVSSPIADDLMARKAAAQRRQQRQQEHQQHVQHQRNLVLLHQLHQYETDEGASDEKTDDEAADDADSGDNGDGADSGVAAALAHAAPAAVPVVTAAASIDRFAAASARLHARNTRLLHSVPVGLAAPPHAAHSDGGAPQLQDEVNFDDDDDDGQAGNQQDDAQQQYLGQDDYVEDYEAEEEEAEEADTYHEDDEAEAAGDDEAEAAEEVVGEASMDLAAILARYEKEKEKAKQKEAARRRQQAATQQRQQAVDASTVDAVGAAHAGWVTIPVASRNAGTAGRDGDGAGDTASIGSSSKASSSSSLSFDSQQANLLSSIIGSTRVGVARSRDPALSQHGRALQGSDSHRQHPGQTSTAMYMPTDTEIQHALDQQQLHKHHRQQQRQQRNPARTASLHAHAQWDWDRDEDDELRHPQRLPMPGRREILAAMQLHHEQHQQRLHNSHVHGAAREAGESDAAGGNDNNNDINDDINDDFEDDASRGASGDQWLDANHATRMHAHTDAGAGYSGTSRIGGALPLPLQRRLQPMHARGRVMGHRGHPSSQRPLSSSSSRTAAAAVQHVDTAAGVSGHGHKPHHHHHHRHHHQYQHTHHQQQGADSPFGDALLHRKADAEADHAERQQQQQQLHLQAQQQQHTRMQRGGRSNHNSRSVDLPTNHSDSPFDGQLLQRKVVVQHAATATGAGVTVVAAAAAALPRRPPPPPAVAAAAPPLPVPAPEVVPEPKPVHLPPRPLTRVNTFEIAEALRAPSMPMVDGSSNSSGGVGKLAAICGHRSAITSSGSDDNNAGIGTRRTTLQTRHQTASSASAAVPKTANVTSSAGAEAAVTRAHRTGYNAADAAFGIDGDEGYPGTPPLKLDFSRAGPGSGSSQQHRRYIDFE